MKREDLKKLEGLTDDVIDKIMALHGQDIERYKSAADQAKAEIDGLKAQLAEANQTIEGFKKLDVEGIKAAADEWKAKAEKAQKDAEAQIQALKFDHALDAALRSARARNPKAVKALLDIGALKLNDADGSIIGLKEQLEKIQSEADYLFESDEKVPRVVAGGNNQSVNNDSFMAALRRGAGLPVE